MVALSGTPTSTFLHKDRSPAMYGREVAKHLGCQDLDDTEKVIGYTVALKGHSTNFFLHPQKALDEQESEFDL